MASDVAGSAGDRGNEDGLGPGGARRRETGDGVRLLVALLVVALTAALMLGASALLVAVTAA